jgi:hypothetical protein
VPSIVHSRLEVALLSPLGFPRGQVRARASQVVSRSVSVFTVSVTSVAVDCMNNEDGV